MPLQFVIPMVLLSTAFNEWDGEHWEGISKALQVPFGLHIILTQSDARPGTRALCRNMRKILPCCGLRAICQMSYLHGKEAYLRSLCWNYERACNLGQFCIRVS